MKPLASKKNSFFSPGQLAGAENLRQDRCSVKRKSFAGRTTPELEDEFDKVWVRFSISI
jgi:hypothetical protein